MYTCKALLSAGSILMLLGVAVPAAAEAGPAAEPLRQVARSNSPATRAQADPTEPLNQPVTLDLVDAPLGSALEAIARRAGLTLAYDPEILPAGRTVTLRTATLSARDVIARVLEGTGLEATAIRGDQFTLVARAAPPTDRTKNTAASQQSVLTGMVTDAGTGAALRGAEVRVEESDLSTMTDADGRYTLEDVPAGTHTLVASVIGYGMGRKEVTVSPGTTATVDFSLRVSAVVLDEMVVTGTMVPTQMRAVPSPVSVVTAEDIEASGVLHFEEILRSIPGLGVISDEGTQSRTSILHVRGATSLDAGQSSIKTYIDGVEVAQPIWSLNQIDPGAIERIELIRGPQASTLHGPEALAGVLQIFTKKGYLGRQNAHIQATISAGHIESPYADGFTPIQHHSIAVRGGEENVSFNVGASYDYTGEWVEDELIDELGWDSDNSISRNLNLSGGVRYTIGRVTAEASARVHTNSVSLPLQKALTEPARDGRWNYVFATRPQGLESGLQAHTYGLTIDYEATPWWKHHIVVGHDRTSVDYRRQQPRETTPADTFLYYQSLDWTRRSVAYSSAVNPAVGSRATSTLQAGFDRSTYDQENVITQDARQLTGGLGNQNADVALGELTNHGFFGQAQVAWQDRIFLTASIRADGSSGFGDDLRYAWSPRVGLAYVIELGDFSIKSRAAYGSAIRPPEPDRKFGRTTPDLDVLANDLLEPEAQSGYDMGIELYLGRRLSLAVTRYDQIADDLVALVHLSDSPDPPRPAQYQNVGRIKNEGWEFEGTINVAALTLRANYSLLESVVEKLSTTYTGSDFVVGERPLWVPRFTGSVTITWATSRSTIAMAMTHKGSWKGYRYVPYFESLLGTAPEREPFTGSLQDYIDDYRPVRRYSFDASYRVTKHATALLAIDNLLNDRRPNRTDLDLVKGRRVTIGFQLDTRL